MIAQSILLIYAHPDDETVFTGGSIAKYAAQGADIHLIAATRGEKGRTSGECTQDQLPITREQELKTVGKVLGITDITFLDYADKKVSNVNQSEISHKIAEIIRRIRPQVIITFGPEGADGHEDHKAIHRFATEAIKITGDETLVTLHNKPFTVPKVYYVDLVAQLRHYFGFEGKATPPTTIIDTKKFSDLKIKALQSHRTQALSLNKFLTADEQVLPYILNQETFTFATEYSSSQNLNLSDLFN